MATTGTQTEEFTFNPPAPATTDAQLRIRRGKSTVPGSEEWFLEVWTQKVRILQVMGKLGLPLWAGAFPPYEYADLHYVSLMPVAGPPPVAKRLILAEARGIADVEDMLYTAKNG